MTRNLALFPFSLMLCLALAVAASTSSPTPARDACIQKEVAALQTAATAPTQAQSDLATTQANAYEKLADLGAEGC